MSKHKRRQHSQYNKNTEVTTQNNTKSEEKKRIPIYGGDRTSYVYFDCKFTNYSKNTTLMSIGFVDYSGNMFYAELTDYMKVDMNDLAKEYEKEMLNPAKNILDGNFWIMKGNRAEVSTQLLFWLSRIIGDDKDKRIQFVSDGTTPNFILLFDLLTNKKVNYEYTSIPPYISRVTYDINQDLATSISVSNTTDIPDKEYFKNYVPVMTASEVSRREFAIEIGEFDDSRIKDNKLTYNSPIVSALITRSIHQYIWALYE